MKDLTIFVVNFNTTKLTNLCLDRIQKHCSSYNYNIKLFDNSNIEKFISDKERSNYEYIDNTNNQIIDYNEFVKNNCRGNDPGNYATPKHAYAIDWMIKNCETSDLLIVDSDALMIKDVDFIDNNFCTACQIEKTFGIYRCLPMIQYINVDMFRKNNIVFCDSNRIRYGLDYRYLMWDTGASTLFDIMTLKLPIKLIKMNDYVIHMGGASWEQIRSGYDIESMKINDFLNKYG